MIKCDDTTNETAEYAAFVDKFKPKKTTDDCYTPANVYDAVLRWAAKEYGLEGRKVLRPFYPGGDYANEDYPEGCVVIDNPPFSILSEICRFYDDRRVDYFLFAPTLTLFSTNAGRSNYIVSDTSITYENGAKIATSFVTNLGEWKVLLSAELSCAVTAANASNTKPETNLPKYEYPDNVITPATLQKIVKRGIELRVPRSDAVFIRAMDQQRKCKKAIFGGGLLLSEKAAAEKAAANRWTLSDRELDIIRQLGVDGVMNG